MDESARSRRTPVASKVTRTTKKVNEKSIDKVDLTNDSPDDKPWVTHKNQSFTLEKMLLKSGDHKRATKSANCGDWLKFRQLEAGQKLRLIEARFCRFRLCPICMWRRSMLWQARFHKALPEIEKMHSKHRFLLLTLTVPNCEICDLKDCLKAMGKGWDRLSKRKNFMDVVDGFLRATEVTKGRAGTAHPHFHVLLMVKASYFNGKGYIKQEKWLQMWRDVMRDQSITQVDIRTIKGKNGTDGMREAAKEVLKYATKVGDVLGKGEDDLPSVAWLTEYMAQSKGCRFMASGGLLSDILREDEETENDLIHTDEDKTADDDCDTGQQLVYRYSRTAKSYFRYI